MELLVLGCRIGIVVCIDLFKHLSGVNEGEGCAMTAHITLFHALFHARRSKVTIMDKRQKTAVSVSGQMV